MDVLAVGKGLDFGIPHLVTRNVAVCFDIPHNAGGELLLLLWAAPVLFPYMYFVTALPWGDVALTGNPYSGKCGQAKDSVKRTKHPYHRAIKKEESSQKEVAGETVREIIPTSHIRQAKAIHAF